ncbi:Peptidoglycan/LPS O-acetylase OafA/YrhL, contains acyltransferase and SGNH-hydrolase domains [Micrococcales bacterium KH10]|nr:Peptidoglycan/LPS O-acetylase OafA/YrhL, contains acyltransferase and SGNH-hydrolase domains [Micrococcales bacterium KH10]
MPKPANRFRLDIEGLRAVAIGMVLVFHAAPKYLPGGFIGVDIFFVISGFLITSLLIREVQRTGTISLRDFYARRARRLLPAATLVLAFSAIVVWFVLPITQRRTFGGDIISAGVSLVNWRLADRSVDYLAEGTGASPVQHYWSLAVEEQFYVIWPLLILLAVVLARHFKWQVRASLAVGIAIVAVPSFIWSVLYSPSNPEVAYFVTTTRLWELGIGAAVALAAPWWPKLPRWFAQVLFFGGIVTLVVAGFVIDASTVWPGFAASAPVLGTAAIIVGGYVVGTSASAAVLTNKPMVWIGSISYSLYLWHWPMLIGAAGIWGELRIREAVLVTLVSIIPAYLSLKLVENPIRFSQRLGKTPRAGLGLGAVLCTTSVIAGAAVILPSMLARPVVANESRQALGAAVLLDDPTFDPATVDSYPQIIPAPEVAVDDRPITYDHVCQVDGDEAVVCEYGVEDGANTVVLVGDSKANQWFSALESIALRNNWRLLTIMRSSCAFSEATLVFKGEIFTSCQIWNAGALEAIEEIQPDLVITSQNAWGGLRDPNDPQSGYIPERMIDGLKERWRQLSDTDIPVIAIAGNPQPPDEMYECVAQNSNNLTDCVFGAEYDLAEVQVEAASLVDAVSVVDLNRYICPNDRCPSVIGGVLLYRQGSHLTSTFVDSLTPVLEGAIMQVLQSMPDD